MKSVEPVLDLIETLLAAACVIAFFLMFVLGIATVFFRFVVESSLTFPEELIRYLFIWVVALGSAVAFRRHAHAAIGIVIEQLPLLFRKIALLISTCGCASFFAILVFFGASMTQRVVPQVSPALEISMAWVYAAVPVGAAFLLLFTCELFVRQLISTPEALETSSL